MRTNKLLILAALVVSIAVVLGWTFEVPEVEGTVGGGELIRNGAAVGAVLGFIVGLGLTFRTSGFIKKFQVLASSVLVSTAALSLLAHLSNRKFGTEDAHVQNLRVKQVTKTWSGRGLSTDDLLSPPDGYFVFVESDEGLVRLFQPGPSAPEVGATRDLPVRVTPGLWGYPRYELMTE